MATKQSNKNVETKAEQKGEKKTTTSAMRAAPKAQARTKPGAQPAAGAPAAATKPTGEAGGAPVATPAESATPPEPVKAPAAEKGAAPAVPQTPARSKKGAKPAEGAASAVAATPTKSKGAAPVVAAPDPRLPAPGTVLQKRDRHGAVRCECTVEKEGIRYAGKVYRSLSAAAMAASNDLGLSNKTANGFTFWGLSKPPRPEKDRLVALERAWERYRGSAESLVKGETGEEGKGKMLAAMRKHADALAQLCGKAA